MLMNVVLPYILGVLVTMILSVVVTRYILNKKHQIEKNTITETLNAESQKREELFKEKLKKINVMMQKLQGESEVGREKMHIALSEKKRIEEKYRELSVRFMQYGDPESDEVPNVSYRTNMIDVSKRVQDAIQPWQIRVEELESQIDLMNIRMKDAISDRDGEYQSKVKILERVISEKEEENVELTLKINKAILAYDALNKRYKALL